MSVLTSADMSVDRSTTRRHAPPGGKSTISFGGGAFADETTPTLGSSLRSSANAPFANNVPVIKAKAPANTDIFGAKEESVAAVTSLSASQTLPAAVEPVVEIEAAVPIIANISGRVGVAIASGFGSEGLLQAAKSSLKRSGVTDISFLEVSDPIMLPYATKSLLTSSDVVIAIGIVSDTSLAQTIISTLLQVGILSTGAVVPSIFSSTFMSGLSGIDKNVTTALALLALKDSTPITISISSSPDTPATVEAVPESPVSTVTEEVTVVQPVETTTSADIPPAPPANAANGVPEKPVVEPTRRNVSNSSNPSRHVGGASSIFFG